MNDLELRVWPRTRSRKAMQCGMLLLLSILMFLFACDKDPMRIESVTAAYQVVRGACGDLIFEEAIGTDSASALAVIEARKTQWFGEGEVRLELAGLSVVDRHGAVPEPNFYGVLVLEAGTGMLAHSLSEVISNEGDLFSLRWCPD